MITTGAICISEVFMRKPSLQHLDMSFNLDVGNEGITAIAEALSNSQISYLYVNRCGFTLTGTRSLAVAAGLLVNNSVEEMYLWGNSITVGRARLILKAAMDNGVCYFVDIDEEHKYDDKAKKIVNILDQRRRHKYPQQITQQDSDSNVNPISSSDGDICRKLCCKM
ncbi:uncharacterized protein [Dysidea avara]|uniref:uncharacterized protein isoform X2 n=1 Tax=Dysidea avara TaxID=196820 RepID=UPI0033286F00